MPPPAITVENLGKRYRIGQREPYYALRDTIARVATAPFRRLRAVNRKTGIDTAESEARIPPGNHGRHPEMIWALRGVGFQVSAGEVVGIIGRNGAGKTTLLKILSRITAPTEGNVTLRGRVGSLLEVGTGFHPELTGRENTYLSGAILGMRKHEIDTRFDAIVAFAEVEKFIDTPIKRYSSGMYVRLAFAVAAHLEPEILLVDEVLAVGDASFQKKCLNKMQDVGSHGRTVLFVSHNMPAITRLCPRTILLDAGGVVCDGPSHEVVGAYLRSGLGSTAHREWSDPATAPGNDIVRLRAVTVRSAEGKVQDAFDIRKPVEIEVAYDVLRDGYVLTPNLHFFNEQGICVFVASDHDPAWRRRPRPSGHYRSTARIPGNFLAEGTVIVTTAISTMDPVQVHVLERDAVAFQVVDSIDGDSARGDYAGPMPGVVRPLLEWRTDSRQPLAASSTETLEVSG